MTGVDFFLMGIVLMLFGWKLYFDYEDRKEERRQCEKNAHHSRYLSLFFAVKGSHESALKVHSSLW